MSFGNFARLARDPQLPLARRIGKLASCVQLYRPIGYEATLSYLRPAANVEAALDMLEKSRNLRKALSLGYAENRTRAKQSGRRFPVPANPLDHFGYWYGAPVEAANHAVEFWRRRRIPDLLAFGHPLAASVVAVVDAGGPPPRDLIEALRDGDFAYPGPRYDQTRELLTLLRLADVAAGGRWSYSAWLRG